MELSGWTMCDTMKKYMMTEVHHGGGIGKLVYNSFCRYVAGRISGVSDLDAAYFRAERRADCSGFVGDSLGRGGVYLLYREFDSHSLYFIVDSSGVPLAEKNISVSATGGATGTESNVKKRHHPAV